MKSEKITLTTSSDVLNSRLCYKLGMKSLKDVLNQLIMVALL